MSVCLSVIGTWLLQVLTLLFSYSKNLIELNVTSLYSWRSISFKLWFYYLSALVLLLSYTMYLRYISWKPWVEKTFPYCSSFSLKQISPELPDQASKSYIRLIPYNLWPVHRVAETCAIKPVNFAGFRFSPFLQISYILIDRLSQNTTAVSLVIVNVGVEMSAP